MFHKVTLLVYALFGGMVGHKIASLSDKDTGATILAVVVGAGVSAGIYFTLRFLRFAESAYRREMVAAPQVFVDAHSKKTAEEAKKEWVQS